MSHGREDVRSFARSSTGRAQGERPARHREARIELHFRNRPGGGRAGRERANHGDPMSRVQVQGVHHITLVGSSRQSRDRFLAGGSGHAVPLRAARISAARRRTTSYFDPGDGRLITVFTNESRPDDPTPHPRGVGHLEHIALTVSRATQTQVAERLEARGHRVQGVRSRIHGLDLFQRPERSRDSSWPATSSRLRRGSPRPTCCVGRID